MALGIVDHGTRACLALTPVPAKGAVTILRMLLQIIERFGKPQILRTDNDGAFRSRFFRAILLLLGIRHQRTDPMAPWQNGRIERFFGTLKQALRWRGANDEPVIGKALAEFRSWYNHLRPHQNLEGRTPAEAWAKRSPNFKRKPHWIEGWDGKLGGYYWPDG